MGKLFWSAQIYRIFIIIADKCEILDNINRKFIDLPDTSMV